VALQVAKALGFSDITAVCSQSNADFCRDCGATQVVSYDSTDNLLESLLQTIIKDGQEHEEQDGYYSVVLDCVTSADPQDSKHQYPHLIQHGDHVHRLLTKDYVYRRLGGPTKDWFRAGMERTIGWGGWLSSHEKLFWIRFPKSSHELEQLKDWVERGEVKVQVTDVVDFTQQGVQEAFDLLLFRRMKGKVVVEVFKEEAGEEEEGN
jgi:NADPH:quinone reductase-like Zn-dependent oxidoreductase